MKTNARFLTLIIFVLPLILASCTGTQKKEKNSAQDSEAQAPLSTTGEETKTSESMHEQHNNLSKNFAHKDIVILDHPYQLSEKEKDLLNQIVDHYLQLKNAMVREDLNAINKMAYVMSEKVSSISLIQLKGEGRKAWLNHKSLYEEKLEEMQHISGLQNKRSYFSHISEIIYCTVKSFDLKNGELFAVFCPMALNKKGAYWVSDKKVFQNPYMGGQLHRCEEIKERL